MLHHKCLLITHTLFNNTGENRPAEKVPMLSTMTVHIFSHISITGYHRTQQTLNNHHQHLKCKTRSLPAVPESKCHTKIGLDTQHHKKVHRLRCHGSDEQLTSSTHTYNRPHFIQLFTTSKVKKFTSDKMHSHLSVTGNINEKCCKCLFSRFNSTDHRSCTDFLRNVHENRQVQCLTAETDQRAAADNRIQQSFGKLV